MYCVTHAGQKAAKILQFWPNFHVLGLVCPPPFTNSGQIWSMLICLISFESVIVSPSREENLQFWTNVDIWGAPVLSLLYRSEPNLVCKRYMLICKISSGLFHSVTLEWRKAPNFVVFILTAFCGVASWQCVEKVECMCTTTNLHWSNGIKIVSVLQHFQGKIMCTNFVVHKPVVHAYDATSMTDTPTNNLTFWLPQGGWNPSPTKLGMVIEDLEHVLAPQKLLWVDARGCWNFWGTAYLNLKPP